MESSRSARWRQAARKYLPRALAGILSGLAAVASLPLAKSAIFALLRNSALFQRAVTSQQDAATFRQTAAVIAGDATMFGLWGLLVSLALIWSSESTRGKMLPRAIPTLWTLGVGGLGGGLTLLLLEAFVLTAAPRWSASSHGTWIFRYAGWVAVGLSIGTGFAFAAPGMQVWRGALVGGFTGLLSGLVCTALIALGFETLGYLHFGFTGAIFCTAIAFSETWGMRYWARVVQPPDLAVIVPIGRRFITIGSGRQETVQICGVARREVRIRLYRGKVQIKGVPEGKPLLMQTNRLPIGSAVVTIESKS